MSIFVCKKKNTSRYCETFLNIKDWNQAVLKLLKQTQWFNKPASLVRYRCATRNEKQFFKLTNDVLFEEWERQLGACMGVLGKSGQGCIGVINNFCALTNLLNNKAILMLPSTGCLSPSPHMNRSYT